MKINPNKLKPLLTRAFGHVLAHAADQRDPSWGGVAVALVTVASVLDGDEGATATLQRWAAGDLSCSVEQVLVEAKRGRGEL